MEAQVLRGLQYQGKLRRKLSKRRVNGLKPNTAHEIIWTFGGSFLGYKRRREGRASKKGRKETLESKTPDERQLTHKERLPEQQGEVLWGGPETKMEGPRDAVTFWELYG